MTSEERSITTSENGSISFPTFCFGGNSGDLPGTVFVDDISTLDVNDDNFGSENVGGNGTCNDIFDEGSGLCVPFEADSCLLPAFTFTATPSVAPSQVPSVLNVTLSPVPSSVPSAMPSISCFSEYDLLAEAVTEAGSNGTGGVFTICPDTVFNLFVPPNSDVLPIVINASDTIIQCGVLGLRSGSCVVLGGSRHFEIAGSVTDVELKGLAFIAITDVTVGAFGSSNASATFDDCDQIDQSVGKASVQTHSVGGSTDLKGKLLPFEEGPMSVEIPNCTFSDISNLEFDAIAHVGGMTLIVDIVF
mmetsp:Transcript_25655/g.32679  ORF Transcript_25655/g.32679 Transcript_25655/m.32679 type:complete len:304 (-) Transcript_25655:305-1216(-)